MRSLNVACPPSAVEEWEYTGRAVLNTDDSSVTRREALKDNRNFFAWYMQCFPAGRFLSSALATFLQIRSGYAIQGVQLYMHSFSLASGADLTTQPITDFMALGIYIASFPSHSFPHKSVHSVNFLLISSTCQSPYSYHASFAAYNFCLRLSSSLSLET
jgi:hypothetical protein